MSSNNTDTTNANDTTSTNTTDSPPIEQQAERFLSDMVDAPPTEETLDTTVVEASLLEGAADDDYPDVVDRGRAVERGDDWAHTRAVFHDRMTRLDILAAYNGGVKPSEIGARFRVKASRVSEFARGCRVMSLRKRPLEGLKERDRMRVLAAQVLLANAGQVPPKQLHEEAMQASGLKESAVKSLIWELRYASAEFEEKLMAPMTK